MTILLILMGILLLGGALGFLVAVSIGSRREDRPGDYRSLRDNSKTGLLGHAARWTMGVTIRDTNLDIPREPRKRRDDDDSQYPLTLA